MTKEKDMSITPAVLKAALAGDIENFVAGRPTNLVEGAY